MAAAPDHSLPKQCDDWCDLKAAYRFLHHHDVSPERIQQTHRQGVRAALVRAGHPVVLAVQDTTELDYTTQTMAQGLGPIGKGTRRGLLQHSTLAVTPDGQLHGVLHQIWRARLPKPEGETRTQMRLRPKESDLWPDSVRAVGSLGDSTRLVHVADRGGDTFDMMLHGGHHGVGFLIRSQKDRRINGKTDKLWSFIARQPAAGHRDVPVPARNGCPARIARLSIRWAQVRLDPPQGDPRFKESLPVWVVQAVETDPPEGVEPIDWILLTSEAVATFEQAGQRVNWYACRWIIEEWHKVEKTGCRLEASQLKNAEALNCLAAFVAVISVRLLQVRDLAQTTLDQDAGDPSLPANQPLALAALVPAVWRIVVAGQARCPVQQLSPRLFWLTIAKRGGYLARKGDGPPGWQTIWKGWSDFMLMVLGVELYLQGNEFETYG